MTLGWSLLGWSLLGLVAHITKTQNFLIFIRFENPFKFEILYEGREESFI